MRFSFKDHVEGKMTQITKYLLLLFWIGCAGENSTSKGEKVQKNLDVKNIQGNFRLSLTDALNDTFESIMIVLKEVKIHSGTDENAGWLDIATDTKEIDLLKLQVGVSKILGDATQKEGTYNQLRLVIEKVEPKLKEGEKGELKIPSGAQTGLKINLNLEVKANSKYVVVLDFNAEESIKEKGNGNAKNEKIPERFMLNPVIKVAYIGLVKNDGTIEKIEVESKN